MLARTVVVSVCLLFSAAGCDPPGAVVEARKDVSGDRVGQAACLDGCAAERLSATDRATCRLNCEASHPVTPNGGAPVLAAAASCLGGCLDRGDDSSACSEPCGGAASLRACVAGCQAESGPDDRATCRLQCAQDAKPAQ